jgi:hypothetical protein
MLVLGPTSHLPLNERRYKLLLSEHGEVAAWLNLHNRYILVPNQERPAYTDGVDITLFSTLVN